MGELLADSAVYLVKCLTAFLVLFLLIPRVIFTEDGEDVTKGIVSGFIKIVFWLIAVGYFLVSVRLFEMISVVALMVVFWFYKYSKNRILEDKISKNVTDDVNVLLINHVERIERIQGKLLLSWERTTARIRYIISWYFGDIRVVTGILLLTAVVGYGAYLTFYDAFTHASPSGHEGFLTLIRSKYIRHRVMFADGIYPQGLYILLAVLQKFAQADHLYIVNFAGPLFGLVIGLGLYFFASRAGAGKAGGIVAATVFCWFGSFSDTSAFLRTVSSPVQMSVLLVFPTLYFFYAYMGTRRRSDFYTALFGAASAGLVHPIGFAFITLGVLALLVAYFLRDIKGSLRFIAGYAGVLYTAAAIAALPAAAGVVAGLKYDKTAVMTASVFDALMPPILTYYDLAAAGALVLILAGALFSVKIKANFVGKLSVLLMGAAAFAAYQYAYILQNKYVFDAAQTLWLLIVPMIFAFAAGAVFDLLAAVTRMKNIGYLFCIAGLIASLYLLPQAPLAAERSYPEQMARQYLLIKKAFRPTQWMIVSRPEGHIFAYGYGYYMQPRAFTEKFDPWEETLREKSGLLSKSLSTQDIAVFYHKNDPTEAYIKAWIDEYATYHSNLSVFYEDDELMIWNIHQIPGKEEAFEGMWQE